MRGTVDLYHDFAPRVEVSAAVAEVLAHGAVQDGGGRAVGAVDGGWSVDASVHLPGWDRHGLERLARYCVLS